ncbi:NUDIX hydrolase [Rhizobium beringeri]|uniref:NUDIX hydrolase n=1 Tax=Rhizobium beringeri TaxID=3019934 RepID=UPI002E1071D2|nr:NUDIX hydrolase [Rhizobium beringeri]WSH68185.1 NUDIX hydrolase [Rhizobium ruizarguesonis]WSH82637.1 NUDIX hydrolase [Rhizobium beringeri]
MKRPVVGAMAVVVREDRLLLVRRRNEPDAGRWSFPAGKIEFGETIDTAAIRELAEETGVSATAGRIITAVDAIDYDDEGKVQHHFVVVALLCQWITGDPQANDDATDARWFMLAELDDLDLPAAFDLKAIARSALNTAQYR